MHSHPSRGIFRTLLESTRFKRKHILGASTLEAELLPPAPAGQRRLLDGSLHLFAALAAGTAIFGCVGGNGDPAASTLKAEAPGRQAAPEATSAAQAEADYFPHRFPTPQGVIEPLPPQF